METISPVKYSLSVEPLSPRLSSNSPCSRYSCAMHSTMEASPRFGAPHPVFASPRAISRRTSASAKIYPSSLSEHDRERPPSDRNAGRPAFFSSSSWKSSTEELFSFDQPSDLDAAAAAATAEVARSSRASAPSSAPDLAGSTWLPSIPPFKRKRPPKLVTLPGGHLVVPSTFVHPIDLGEDALNEMTVEGSCYGISCKKGRREVLEDTHRAVPELNGDPCPAFFGVFDGHGGRKAADFAAESLVLKIAEALDNHQEGEASMKAAVRAGYLATDAAFLRKRVGSGASCVTAVIKNGYLLVANAGDCRAVLSRAGSAEALTRDHRAGREDERQRIESLGGFVDDSTGTWRVQGSLAVTRGIGDLHLKEWISAEPEIQSFQITPDCEFVILASDGLWDVVTNEEAVDTAKSTILGAEHRERSSLQDPYAQDRGDTTTSPFQLKQMVVETMDSEIPLTMASSGFSKNAGDGQDSTAGMLRQCSQVGQGLEENLNCSHSRDNSLDVGRSISEQDTKVQAIPTDEDDEVDVCVGTIDADLPNLGFPEPRVPTHGLVDACKKLVEMSTRRGCHDDVSVMIVNLARFRRQPSFVV